jgi:hypothetical protein
MNVGHVQLDNSRHSPIDQLQQTLEVVEEKSRHRTS